MGTSTAPEYLLKHRLQEAGITRPTTDQKTIRFFFPRLFCFVTQCNNNNWSPDYTTVLFLCCCCCCTVPKKDREKKPCRFVPSFRFKRFFQSSSYQILQSPCERCFKARSFNCCCCSCCSSSTCPSSSCSYILYLGKQSYSKVRLLRKRERRREKKHFHLASSEICLSSYIARSSVDLCTSIV